MNLKSLRRLSLFVVALASVSIAVLAQKPVQSITPSVDRLREVITYLASDALEGRRTGSAGANDAAHYIAGEFQRLGLRPGFSSPRRPSGETLAQYEQRFPYVAGVELGKKNTLSIQFGGQRSAVDLEVGENWMPLGFSSTGEITNASSEFVGYGITATELRHDDYANNRAKDKVAIALAGTPDGDNPHGKFAQYDDVRWKAVAAKNAGARALIIVAREQNFKEDRLHQLRYENSAGDAGILVLAISQQVGLRLFGAQDMTFLAGLAKDSSLSVGFSNSFRQLSIDLNRHEIPAANVIGILEGTDPQLKNEAIVIGAHYDHLGRGGEGSLAPREGEIHHGADDNASGIAGLIELARMFSGQNPRPRRTIVFIAFSGEEEGLLGSNYYVNHPAVPLANTTAMVNMDMIGRMKSNKLIVGGIGTATEWRTVLDQANLPVAITASMRRPATVSDSPDGAATANLIKEFDLTLNEDGYGPSDHSSFYAKKVPVLFFFTGSHEDYHKPSDTADKINYDGEARIVALVARVIQDIDQRDQRPTYAVAKSESTGRATGFRVYLGTIPNYAETTDGVLLDGVRDDSPAAKAGVKAGDKIVKLAGRDVRNVYDYTYALGEMKAGQEYEIEVMRGGERLKLKITPAARK